MFLSLALFTRTLLPSAVRSMAQSNVLQGQGNRDANRGQSSGLWHNPSLANVHSPAAQRETSSSDSVTNKDQDEQNSEDKQKQEGDGEDGDKEQQDDTPKP